MSYPSDRKENGRRERARSLEVPSSDVVVLTLETTGREVDSLIDRREESLRELVQRASVGRSIGAGLAGSAPFESERPRSLPRKPASEALDRPPISSESNPRAGVDHEFESGPIDRRPPVSIGSAAPLERRRTVPLQRETERSNVSAYTPARIEHVRSYSEERGIWEDRWKAAVESLRSRGKFGPSDSIAPKGDSVFARKTTPSVENPWTSVGPDPVESTSAASATELFTPIGSAGSLRDSAAVSLDQIPTSLASDHPLDRSTSSTAAERDGASSSSESPQNSSSPAALEDSAFTPKARRSKARSKATSRRSIRSAQARIRRTHPSPKRRQQAKAARRNFAGGPISQPSRRGVGIRGAPFSI